MTTICSSEPARRSFLKHGAVLAGVLAPSLASAVTQTADFSVLHRAALASRKSSEASLIAVARCGQRLVAVGERGIVLLSEEGSTWRQAQVPVSVTLTAVQFVDDKTGWATGHLGVVLVTYDAGETWSKQLDGVRAAQLVRKREAAATDATGDKLVEDGPDKPFLDLHFEDAGRGWIVGAYGLALQTEDGGKSWFSVMDRVPNAKGLHLYAIVAAGDALFLAGEQGLLLRSTNKGATFEALPSPSKGTYFGLVVGRHGELLLYGLRGRAFVSTDSGSSWIEVETGTRTSLSAGIALTNGALLLASQAGELLMSRDRGRTFKAVASPHALPFTALAESSGTSVVATSMRGIKRLSVPAAVS